MSHPQQASAVLQCRTVDQLRQRDLELPLINLDTDQIHKPSIASCYTLDSRMIFTKRHNFKPKRI
jgi:hypothetical protein